MDEQTPLAFLLEKVRRNKGADFSLYRTGTLKRRIETRLRATGCADYMEYGAVLNREPEEYDRLLSAITINVTGFFRDPETFEVLKTAVIPEIVRSKETQDRRVIRAWSAGCANGEEAYSLAILFLEFLRERRADSVARRGLSAPRSTLDDGQEFHVRIYGTDINGSCVEQAKAGVYPPASSEQVPADYLKRYFRRQEDGFAILDSVKRLTRFEPHNLASDPFLPHMDLILCRNVAIYFTKPLQEMVYSSFARALNAGGFLVLGKVEALWGAAAAQFEVGDLRNRIYRRKKGEPNAGSLG